MAQRLARLAHNQKVVGSNPTPAFKKRVVMIDELREILGRMRTATTYYERITHTMEFINEAMNQGGDSRGPIAIQFNSELDKLRKELQE